ncbi:MAG TPA: hypothetical protein EYO96_05605 [Candidatus Marinimicrobia bacterium]|nr:hypothetical protein [Candidatus Neomarinimicrobiota bacterium]
MASANRSRLSIVSESVEEPVEEVIAEAAKEMMLFGGFVDAPKALEWGLVNAVTEPDALLAEARRWADALLALPPLSLANIKGAVNTAMDVDLESGTAYEQRCSTVLAMTDDRREGYSAFAEKRQPHFTGR